MTILASTLHDPEGRMAPLLAAHLPSLARRYAGGVVVASPETVASTLRAVAEAGFEVCADATSRGAIGEARRRALAGALRLGAEAIHYCDFDRLLHWQATYPDELARVVARCGRAPYLIIGRTSRAFATHPLVQIDAEAATNHAISRLLGREVDVTAGSCGCSAAGARLILAHSVAPTNATDGEWPAIVALLGNGALDYVETEGLEFETGDLYPEEVAALGGYDAWLAARSIPLEAWESRLRLAHETICAALAIVRQAAGR